MNELFDIINIRNMKRLDSRWRAQFRSMILDRGKDYFYRGLVNDLEADDNHISASVGENEYDVDIYLYNDKVVNMYCSCPYATGGNNCKHEAAVLFAYENSDLNDDKEPMGENPFIEDFKDRKEYYFNLYELTKKMKFAKDRIEQARKIVEEGKIRLIKVQSGFVEQYGETQSIYVDAEIIDGHHVISVYGLFNKDSIDYLNCSDYSCRGYFSRAYYYNEHRDDKLCQHKIALLLMLRDYILRNNPGDFTDRRGDAFLNSFGNVSYHSDEDNEIKEDIKLIPKLEYSDMELLKLGFRIGKDKMYVARKFPELVRAVNSKEKYSLSSKEEIDFSRHAFDKESKEYFLMIEAAVNDEKTRESIRNMDYYSSVKDSKYFNVNSNILLYGKRLDEFFDMAEGEKIELTNKTTNRKNEVELIRNNPDIKLHINKLEDGGRFEGITLKGSIPSLINGGSSTYYLDDSHLCRVDDEFAGVLRSLKQGSRNDDISIRIGKRRLAQFYNHILPALKDNVTVINNDEAELEKHLPHKPVFDYYFDVNNSLITCEARITYGDRSFNLTNIDPSVEARDYYEEYKVGQLLLKYFKDVDDRGILCAEGNDDIIYDLLEDLIPELMKNGNVHSTDAFDRLKLKRKTNVSVAVSIDNNLLELDISTDDMTMEELAQVIDSYRLKKKYHKLKSGELIRVDDESIESLDALLTSLNISLKDFVKGKLHIPSYRALYLDKLLEENESIYDERDIYFKRLIKDFKTIKESEYEVPDTLKDIMRGYQKEGFRWLKTLSSFGFGGILADEMGLGKTIQMMALLYDYKLEKGELSSLIVCPSSLIYNWLAEIRKFVPELDVAVVAGNQNERKKIINEYDRHDVLITSYDLLKRDVDLYEGKHFVFEILDEAQYIKTYTTANAKASKVIDAEKRFVMTGTPIENNLSELWSIFDYLMPGFLYSHDRFKDRFEVKIVKEEDKKAAERLKQMVSPFILRRKKIDVLSDLPEKIEETLKVRFDDKQQKLYDSQVLKISKVIDETSDESFAKNKIAILAELTRIRQICCEPSLIYDNYDGESAKKEACIELLINAIDEGHKILLFSQFTSMLEIIENELDKNGIQYYKITGQTKKEERLQLVDRFNTNDVPVFLISLKAGGTGLNLTGADIVIHYDPWWNVAAQNQATDRTHRIGQNKVVTVYKIIAENSIEEKILELQDKKAELAESILSGESKGIASLSKEELLDLLSVR